MVYNISDIKEEASTETPLIFKNYKLEIPSQELTLSLLTN